MRILRLANKIIEYGFYTLFFATPLLFNPSRTLPSFELFEWNKMMFVYALTSLIVSSWIAKMILQRKILIQRTPFNLPLLLFLLSQGLSTLFSIDPHVSIFGYYSRFHGGLLSTFTYVLLYFAFVSNREVIKINKLLSFALASGALVATYGILEKFGIDAQMWVQDVRARVFSTLGQPNWLAAYLVVLLLISLGVLTAKFKDQNEKLQFKKIYHFGLSFLILIFYICILLTKSRSGFLGFWAANAVFWMGTFMVPLFRHPGKSRLNGTHPGSETITDSGRTSFARMTTFIILNSLFLILNFFVRTPFPQYNQYLTTQLFQKEPVPEEKAPVGDSVINVGITDSADIRRIVWKGALDIARAYPLFGTGPETFAYAYYKYRPAQHNLTSEWDFLYNRAHNEFLNIAATSGFLGLGLYLFLIISVIIWGVKSLLTIKQSNNKTILIALLASYISILITNFFGFSVVIIGLYFFLIPAISFALVHPEYTSDKSITVNPPQYILIALILGLTIYAWFTLGRFWLSDSLYAKSHALTKQNNYREAYSYIVAATNFRSDEPVYHDERASIASNLAYVALENQSATLAADLAKEAITESSQALKTSPQNVNFWKTRTRIFFLLASVEPTFIDEALSSILIAQQLAPTDAKVAYNVAVLYGRAGKNEEAIATLKRTIDLKPDYRDAYIALAIFYQDEKQNPKAKAILEEALRKINPDDTEIKQRLEQIK